eukprot:COSAG03_NODE_27567_length_252_cov_1.013072_1_plen_47_part_10
MRGAAGPPAKRSAALAPLAPSSRPFAPSATGRPPGRAPILIGWAAVE